MKLTSEYIKVTNAARLKGELEVNVCGKHKEGYKAEALFVIETNPNKTQALLLCHRLSEKNTDITLDLGNGTRKTIPLFSWLKDVESYPRDKVMVLAQSTEKDARLVSALVHQQPQYIISLVPTLAEAFDPFNL